VAIAMKGNPFFVQKRPGKDCKIFKMIKYRTMTNAKDKEGNLLPDEDRLTGFGNLMRKLSIDELPELFNIFKGDMSVVGPRPQLIKDMIFFDDEIMKRQSVRPGLTGLAQVRGRNNISWEEKFKYDLEYIEKITFFKDIKIIFKTVFKVIKSSDITTEGMATAEDYGDYLLRNKKVSQEEYARKIEGIIK
jgi:lipopolysaccharide/colanic/teichoic acid biosynthesis glycosyltransferase